MLRIKPILLGLLVGFAVSMSVPAMASAREYVVNKTPIGAISEEFKGYQIPFSRSTVEAKLRGMRVGVVCFSITTKGSLEKEGKSKGEIFFANCAVYEYSGGKRSLITGCSFPNRPEYKLSYNGKLPAGEEEPINQEWTGSEPAELFGFIEITGAACAVKGKYELKDVQHCAWAEPLVESLWHGWECTSTGSELKLEREKLEPVEARFWYLVGVFVKSEKIWGVK